MTSLVFGLVVAPNRPAIRSFAFNTILHPEAPMPVVSAFDLLRACLHRFALIILKVYKGTNRTARIGNHVPYLYIARRAVGFTCAACSRILGYCHQIVEDKLMEWLKSTRLSISTGL